MEQKDGVVPNKLDHYAIVVGINNYPKLGSGSTAETNAANFLEWLKTAGGGDLSAANIQVIFSSGLAGEPQGARPVAADIDQALVRFGAQKQQRIGHRLYFYFAGRACGTSFDDTALLMADAEPANLSGISLKAYRSMLCVNELFDEVVYVLDCVYVDSAVSFEAKAPQLTLGPVQPTSSVKEFLLMSSPLVKTEPSVSNADADSEGLVTKAVLDGLRGSGANQHGMITSTSLADYVRRRVRDLASGSKLLNLPDILLPEQEILFGKVSVSPLVGTLSVQVPHWSAEVKILNNLFQSVVSSIEIKESSVSAGTYEAEVKLPEGIYKVEVLLEGKSESQLVAIQFNQASTILKDTWKNLEFASAAPLLGSATTHEWHMQPAVAWSRQITWDKSPGGSSRLFLFVRTSQPDTYKQFAEGLRLLDADEQTITDFSDSVEKDAKNGWMAFCADLPPGFYIIRRGRMGVRLRQQPLYLCAGWETQVFLEARTSPSLRTMTMNMARKGVGFKPDDETTIAVEAVLDSMRYGAGNKQLVTREKLTSLLKGKFENPWLGILACYALLFQPTEQPEAADQNKSLLGHVLNFLDDEISDHPDVRALRLQSDQPAAAPFLHPPLMRDGLGMVHRHSMLFKETIPLYSLTDRIIANLVANSPWTAWRHFADRDKIDDSVAPAISGSNEQWVRSLTETALSHATSILQTKFPKAPVVQLAQLLRQTMGGQKPSKAITRKALVLAVQALGEAPLLDILQTMTRIGDLDLLPSQVTLKNDESLKGLLASVKAEEVSKTSGLSLAHAEKGLESLRQATSPETEVTKGRGKKPTLTVDEQAVLEYIVAETTREKTVIQRAVTPEGDLESIRADAPPPAGEGGVSDDAGAAGESPDGQIAVQSSSSAAITIEDCVGAMRGEAARILIPFPADTAHTAIDSSAKKLSERLLRVSERLFERSAFTIMMNNHAKIISANRAFIHLIEPADDTLDQKSRTRQQKANVKAWEKALSSAPVEDSVLSNPVSGASPAAFSLRKAVVQNETTPASKAYLITMRVKGAASVTQTKLQEVNELLPSLSLHSSLFAYAMEDERADHLTTLEQIIQKLEDLFNDGVSAAAAT